MHALAGILAEKLFHYDVKDVAEGGINHDLENASSLSSALLVSLLVPWGLCFFFYFGEPLDPTALPCCQHYWDSTLSHMDSGRSSGLEQTDNQISAVKILVPLHSKQATFKKLQLES